MRYRVLQFTLCDGWVNTWQVDDEPKTFDSYAVARAELDDFLAEIQAEIASGERDPDNGYSADDFRIAPVNSHGNESTTDAHHQL